MLSSPLMVMHQSEAVKERKARVPQEHRGEVCVLSFFLSFFVHTAIHMCITNSFDKEKKRSDISICGNVKAACFCLQDTSNDYSLPETRAGSRPLINLSARRSMCLMLSADMLWLLSMCSVTGPDVAEL